MNAVEKDSIHFHNLYMSNDNIVAKFLIIYIVITIIASIGIYYVENKYVLTAIYLSSIRIFVK